MAVWSMRFCCLNRLKMPDTLAANIGRMNAVGSWKPYGLVVGDYYV